jgi:hypothetical protein
MDNQKAKFEEWAKGRGIATIKKRSGNYMSNQTQDFWNCWKAAMRCKNPQSNAGGVDAPP